MYVLVAKLTPIFLLFLLGILLKKVRVADTNNADFLLRIVFLITLPSLILVKLSQTPFTWDKIFLPLISIGVNLSCLAATLFICRFMQIPRITKGVVVISTMIANNAFMFPFILVGFGDSGFVEAVLYDFGNALTTATVAYLFAFKYADSTQNPYTMVIKLIQSPLFWVFIVATGLSFFSISLPEYLVIFFEDLGQMTSPLIIITLGIFFRPQFVDLKLVSLTVFIRVGIGMAVGTVLAYLAGLTGQTFSVVLLCSAAPVGFAALMFSSIAHLDKEFASRVVSISILLGIIYIPILMFLMSA